MSIRKLLVSLVLMAASSLALAEPVSVERLPTVVDSMGVVVGNTADGDVALRRVNGQIARFFVDSLTPYASSVIFFHVAADCSDQRYLISSSGRMYLPAELGHDPLTSQPVSFIGSGPLVILNIEAQEDIEDNCEGNGGTLLANGYCCVSQPRVDTFRAAQPLALPVFTPPITTRP
jgi:hypothetical protein